MTDHLIVIGSRDEMCIHMRQLSEERGYVRNPETGNWDVEMCVVPKSEIFRDQCGKIVPKGGHCLTCKEQAIAPPPDHLVELNVCHRRCPRCKWVTKGCNVQRCAHCDATNLTLLPVVINPDAYGFNVANP